MNVYEARFSATSMVAAACEVMESSGFAAVSIEDLKFASTAGARAYEDEVSVVGIFGFETWFELNSNWIEAQAAVAGAMSSKLDRHEAKSWEGYLVLLTPSLVPSDDRQNAADIRMNVSNMRKLLISADDLRSINDMKRMLQPVLPLDAAVEVEEVGSIFDSLPQMLERHHVDPDFTRRMVSAFENGDSLMESAAQYLAEIAPEPQ